MASTMRAAPAYDAVIVGGGHNGLVTAAYLGRAGLRPLVLERRELVGGALADVRVDGARLPALADTVGRLRPSVIRDLHLYRHGLAFIRPDVRAYAPQLEGPAVTLWADPAQTAQDLRPISTSDADGFVDFDRKVRAVASFLAYVDASTP